MGESAPGRALQVLVGAAAGVVVLAGLKAAGDVLLPILFSGVLSVVALPAVRWLQRRGLPSGVAIALVVGVAALTLAGVGAVLAGSVRSFTREIGRYNIAFDALEAQVAAWGDRFGLGVSGADVNEFVTPAAVMIAVRQTLNGVVALLGQTLIVVVTLLFLLIEASDLEQKLRGALGYDPRLAGPLAGVGPKVQRYLLIKSAVSLVTGLGAGAVCWALGIEFWRLWALLAFLLNYIPSIGSVIAGIPPVLLAAVELGWPGAVTCAAAYLALNFTLGNLVEPRILGQSLGLSPLVVFLSLVFWGWLWGPVGMLLCVPLTAMVQQALEATEQTRWIAVFLGSPRGVRRRAEGAPPGTR